jgi:hypothetical protein
MTDDRSLERAARAWLDEGPIAAPDRPVEAALTRIQTTSQERDLRIPWVAWRPTTMMDRLAVAAAVAVLAIGTLALGASLVVKPHEPAAGACPRELTEADAVDTFAAGLSQAQRAWGISGGRPARVRPGLIAAFAWGAGDAPLSLITIDPATAARCRLLRFVEDKPIRENLDPIAWSPSGDALAIGIENPQPPEADPRGQTGQILVWTPSRLMRIWAGEGQIPSFEWAPDGRSMAVWSPSGGPSFNARIVYADGSPDREFGVQPYGGDYLKWSPDGSRWIVSQVTDAGTTSARSNVAVVDLADGRLTPVNIGISWLTPKGWIDNERVLFYGRESGADIGYVDVPLATPESYSVVPLPEGAPEGDDRHIRLSPDLRRATYSNADGDREIADLTGPPGGAPIRVDVGRGFTPGVAWAPDGSQLVLVTVLGPSETNPGYATWIANADGTNVRQLVVGNVWTMDDSWQPVPVR